MQELPFLNPWIVGQFYKISTDFKIVDLLSSSSNDRKTILLHLEKHKINCKNRETRRETDYDLASKNKNKEIPEV